MRVFSWWQNGLMAGVFGFCALLFACLGPHQPAVFGLVALYAVIAVRTAMVGVSRDRAGLIRIHGVLRTWKLRPEQILYVEATEYQRLDGRRYFAPVVHLDRTVDRRTELQLWWLSGFTERGAQKWADRVTALLRSAK